MSINSIEELEEYLQKYNDIDNQTLVYNPISKRKNVKVETVRKAIYNTIEKIKENKVIDNKEENKVIDIYEKKEIKKDERREHRIYVKKYSEKILSIIELIISNYRDSINDWTEYKSLIIEKFNKINFNKKVNNYIPCDNKLYVTRPALRTFLTNHVWWKNMQFFRQVSNDDYEPKDYNIISREDFYKFIEDCVKIIAKKQQGK
jgi:hypothetical protein